MSILLNKNLLNVKNKNGKFESIDILTGPADDFLSSSSTNYVQNKVLKAEFDKKANIDQVPSIKVNNALNADTVSGHTVGIDIPTPETGTQDRFLRSDGTWVDITTTSDLDNWGQARDGITDVNNLPLGFSAVIEGTHEHSPDSFWSTVLTMGSSINETYRQQISFPWSSTGDLKIKYRVEDNGTWTDWNDVNVGGSDISKYIGTWGSPESYYGEQLKMRVLYNKFGDSRFGLTTDTNNEIRCDYATKADSATNADTVAGYTVASNVPANAVFTDTKYDLSPYLLTSNLSSTLSGMNITAKGYTATNPDGFRIACGNYGFFIRNDSVTTYFMLTNSGDPNGIWNNFRPIYITNSTGAVGMGNGLSVGNGFSASAGGASLTVHTGGTSIAGWLESHAGRSSTPRGDYTTYQWRNTAASTSTTPASDAIYSAAGSIYLQYS